MNIQELEPLVEANHLRRVLDTQPSCLMRLGADGTVLAANDAALKLIGAASGAQVLGRDFTAWVPPDQRDLWTAFTTGVVQGHPASVECDIEAPYGDRQPTLFHGVPLSDHPDGVASMAVAARAVSGQRQLEAAVIELEEQLRERDAERFMARARLAQSASSQRELVEKVGALEASLRPPGADAELEEQVRQLKADLEIRATALSEAEAAQRAAEAKAARALADVQQLEVALDGFAARQKQMSAARAEHDALQSRLGEALAACDEREAALRELEAAHTSLEASHASLTAEHASLTEEHGRLVRSLHEMVVQMEALANGFPAAAAAVEPGAPGGFRTGGEEGPA